jgi:hypothetical protein
MERQRKIKLLKDISAGVTTAEDLQEKRFKIQVGLDGAKYFINDKEVSKETFIEKQAIDKKLYHSIQAKIVSYMEIKED